MRTTILPVTKLRVRPSALSFSESVNDIFRELERMPINTEHTQHTSFQETEQAFLYTLDVPGVSKKNIELNIEGDLIKIKALKKTAFSEEKDEGVTINKTLQIPEGVDSEKIQAHCEDGILYLALPKAEKAKPRKIPISDGKSESSSWKNLLGIGKE